MGYRWIWYKHVEFRQPFIYNEGHIKKGDDIPCLSQLMIAINQLIWLKQCHKLPIWEW